MNDSTAALGGTALRCIAWGLGIGTAAGGTAGTLIIPIVGTAYGMVAGFVVAVIPTAAGTVAVLVVLAVRHRRDVEPALVARDVGRIFTGLVALLLVAGVAYLVDIGTDSGWIVLWATAVMLGTTAVTVAMLRLAHENITAGWCRSLRTRVSEDRKTGR